MPGETKADVSGWTVDTLKAYFERVFGEINLRFEQRFDAQEKAVTKAETAAEKRFDSVNEFRSQLGDQAATFIPRLEAEQRIKALDDKIAAITKICIAVVMLGIAIITVVLLILRR